MEFENSLIVTAILTVLPGSHESSILARASALVLCPQAVVRIASKAKVNSFICWFPVFVYGA